MHYFHCLSVLNIGPLPLGYRPRVVESAVGSALDPFSVSLS